MAQSEWPLWIGIGGRFKSESVAVLDRNQWPLCVGMRNLRARLLDTPATTTRGVIAKMRGFYHDGEVAQMMAGDDPDDALEPEFAASIYRDLERLAGEVGT